MKKLDLKCVQRVRIVSTSGDALEEGFHERVEDVHYQKLRSKRGGAL